MMTMMKMMMASVLWKKWTKERKKEREKEDVQACVLFFKNKTKKASTKLTLFARLLRVEV